MYSHALIASAALMATGAIAQSVGKAIVVNKCTYPVYLCDTPAADGGYSDISQWLNANGGTFNQSWTELTNGDGWSIKLSKSTDLSTNLLQYEYTFHNDGQDIIWFDLSAVNGNPWDQNWEITATSASGECNPKQQAYRYATDDAYGMQACPQDSVITVTLCSGESQNDGGAASASSSAAAQTSIAATKTSTFSTPSLTPSQPTSSKTSVSSAAAATTSSVAAPSTTAQTSSAAPVSSSAAPVSSSSDDVASVTVQPTTFATSTLAVYTPHPGVTITEVQTAVVTEVVTATHWHHQGKRHEHHRRHAADRS